MSRGRGIQYCNLLLKSHSKYVRDTDSKKNLSGEIIKRNSTNSFLAVPKSSTVPKRMIQYCAGTEILSIHFCRDNGKKLADKKHYAW